MAAVRLITRFFPLLAIVFAGAAWLYPQWLIPLKPYIAPLLGLVMFGMGITLLPADFRRVARRPLPVVLGMALQFGVMPAAAWLVAGALDLPEAYLIGLVLVGACPGGTASNVICYLARGDVALSITLTSCSTLLAVLATPALSLLYLGRTVDVPAQQMLLTILYVILLPVAAGLLVNRLLGDRLGRIRAGFPAVSVLAIVVIIGIVVALNHGNFAGMTLWLVGAVVLHNALGLAGGYAAARALGQPEAVARTLAIEVGMQNSGLAVTLALKYFSAAAALPGALFSVWHNVAGAVLAAVWSRNPADT